jgi:hypothetical protein
VEGTKAAGDEAAVSDDNAVVFTAGQGKKGTVDDQQGLLFDLVILGGGKALILDGGRCEKKVFVLEAGGDIPGDKRQAVDAVGRAVDVNGTWEGGKSRVHSFPPKLALTRSDASERQR